MPSRALIPPAVMRAKILSEGETVGAERSRLSASLYALLGKQNAATHELYSDTADLCARPEFQEGAIPLLLLEGNVV